jgi:4a-hydroxytetrahydrobiopterin dehydratase
MDDLVNQACEVCRVGAPRATPEEIQAHLESLSDWEVLDDNGVNKLSRTYKTASYRQTIEMVNAIADLSETAGHHPVLGVEYRALTVLWWTHKIKGLHRNDFIMAAKSDAAWARMATDAGEA